VLKLLEHEPSVVRQIERDRVVRLAAMLDLGLRHALEAMELTIDQFLSANYGIVVGTESTIGLLNNKPDMFHEVDWSGLHFRPAILPAAQVFASQPLVAGLVDKEDEELIAAFVTRYYAKYFSMESIWEWPSLVLIVGFLTETLAFRALATSLQAVLAPENESELSGAKKKMADLRLLLQKAVGLPLSMRVSPSASDTSVQAPPNSP
jgi:hypothetical protein